MIDRRRLDHADLVFLDHCRHRDHDPELLRVALDVADHGHHGALAAMGEHDLGRTVE